jgi:hypothetical protein
MLTIACVLRSRDSEIYNPEWVYKLKNSVARNLTLPHRFVCLTDVPLDCEHVMLTAGADGWWSKIQLFKPKLFNYETLYLDLDVVISKSLDSFILNLRQKPYNFLMSQELPGNFPNSSLMYWLGDQSYLYKKYKKDSDKFKNKYTKRERIGDQAFIAEHCEHLGFLNDCFSTDFILWTKDINFKFTENTGMVVFLGTNAKPHLAKSNPYILNNWI